MIKKTGFGLLLVVLGSLSVVNTANARWAVPLINPGSSSWGCDLSLSEVKKGIDMGLIIKNWVPSNEQTGYTQGNNLKHKVDDEGVEKIHPNANSWMENLKNAITVVLKGKCN
jgi:hypothetical protein